MGPEMNDGGRQRGGRERDVAGGRVRPWWAVVSRAGRNEVPPELPDGASFDDEPPVDLSALAGLRLDAGARGGAPAPRWDDLVARIERAAAPELERRARLASGVLDFVPLLARSVRPALVVAAAALVLGVALSRMETAAEGADLASLTATAQGAAASADIVAGQLLSDATDERALPFSTADEAWIAQQRAPSTAALAEAIGLGEVTP